MSPVAVVTGAASGIGQGLALALARRGDRVVAADIATDALNTAFGGFANVTVTRLDVRDAEGWQGLISQTVAAHGQLDTLLNIAGVIRPSEVHETSVADIDRHIDVNLKGVMYGTRAAAEHMVRNRSGHIVNIASLGGVAPVPGLSSYVASKFAVRGYSLSAALDLRPHGVFVSVVCPDLVDTPMLDQQLVHPEAAVTFSGSRRPLTVAGTTALLLRVMRDKPLEATYPAARGLTAKLVSAVPGLALRLLPAFVRRGRARQTELLKERQT
jgi:NAD(P)-dependent dehydrogenase (short-subunit alcohol dehydrogenase family)